MTTAWPSPAASQATGRTITAAAAIMVLVFGSFILGGQVVIKMFGLGLAGAVLLDALIVRMALVPALMLLLGKLNWALPRLARPHPPAPQRGGLGCRARRPRSERQHPHVNLHPPLRPQPAES